MTLTWYQKLIRFVGLLTFALATLHLVNSQDVATFADALAFCGWGWLFYGIMGGLIPDDYKNRPTYVLFMGPPLYLFFIRLL